jgi:hypothetical protein
MPIAKIRYLPNEMSWQLMWQGQMENGKNIPIFSHQKTLIK